MNSDLIPEFPQIRSIPRIQIYSQNFRQSDLFPEFPEFPQIRSIPRIFDNAQRHTDLHIRGDNGVDGGDDRHRRRRLVSTYFGEG